MSNIALFGTVFMDVKGFSANPYDPIGRNPGLVKFIHGGVGRNVAEDLGVLGVPVTLVSTVDQSGIGDEIISRLQGNCVNTKHLRQVEENGMGMWLAILDQHGDLAGSISRMPDLKLFEDLIDEKGEEIIKESTHVAIEIDLNEAISDKVIALARKYNKPVYGLPGNLEVTLKHPELLAGMECFVCNDIEAGKLFEVTFDAENIEAMQVELQKFANAKGICSMVVTMGEKGAMYYHKGNKESGYYKVQPVKMVDSTGAGDSFFAGLVTGFVKGYLMRESVQFASRVAAYTIQSEESTCIGFQLNK